MAWLRRQVRANVMSDELDDIGEFEGVSDDEAEREGSIVGTAWTAVAGRPHLVHQTLLLAGQERWKDIYRDQVYDEDPGNVIKCTRRGCCCTFDVALNLFDSSMCGRPGHGDTGHDDQPAFSFGRREGHKNKECCLCLGDKLDRAKARRQGVARAPSGGHDCPKLDVRRFYAFYNSVCECRPAARPDATGPLAHTGWCGADLGEYRPMIKAGLRVASRWRQRVAIRWGLSGHPHTAMLLRMCRDLRNSIRRHSRQLADAGDEGGGMPQDAEMPLKAEMLSKPWLKAFGWGSSGEHESTCAAASCACSNFSTALCDRHCSTVAGNHLFTSRGGAVTVHCLNCRIDARAKKKLPKASGD